LEATSLFDKIWTVGPEPVSFVPCALCLLARRPAGRKSGGQPAIVFLNDNLVIIYKQNKLLFIRTSLWRYRQ